MNLILSLITGFVGTAIGAFAGAWCITKLQDSKNKEPRKLLLNTIDGFKGYETYADAEKQFNKLSLVEKKAILVALKNLGVPVLIQLLNDGFDLGNITFGKERVDDNELKRMSKYVRDGLCDKLFFNEIDSNFSQVNPKIIRAREFAIKVLNAMRHQSLSITAGRLAEIAELSFNQFEVVYVFWKTLNVSVKDCNDLNNINCDKNKIDEAIKDVNNGIFDHLYYWDHRVFENINSQRLMADNLNSSAFSKG